MKTAKTLLTALAVCSASFSAMAQPSKVNTALYYITNSGDEFFADAKKNIDEAALNEKTQNSTLMWYVRAKVYFYISQSTKAEIKGLDAGSSLKSGISLINFFRATDLRKFSTEKEDAVSFAPQVVADCFNAGVAAQDAKNYPDAYTNFQAAFDLLPFDENNALKDQLTQEKIVYSLYTVAAGEGSIEKQKLYLEKLVSMNWNDPKPYLALSRIYMDEKNEVKGKELLENASAKFPDSREVILEEVNYYISKGDEALNELLAKVNKGIDADPNNPQFYFVRGVVLEKQNKNGEAKLDYLKALEINENMYDAAWNLSALYLKDIDSINNMARSIEPTSAKGKELEAKKVEIFKSFRPYAEKAFSNEAYEPAERIELAKILKKIYFAIDEVALAKEMDDKIADLKSKI